MKKSRKTNESGFTLIEILLVIAIIGILASTILVSLNDAKLRARDANRKMMLKSIRTVFDMYYNDNGFYPGGIGTPSENANSWIHNPLNANLLSALTSFLGGATTLPADPTNDASHRFYYDGRVRCTKGGILRVKAFLYATKLESGAGNLSEYCDSIANVAGVPAGSDTSGMWVIELYR